MTAIDALLDTSVLIALWRKDVAAHMWLQSISPQTVMGLPVLVAMELVDGVRDAAERQRASKMIALFPIIYVDALDSVWAQTQHAQFKLSHNVGIIDALIASASVRLNIPLYTLNIKHFTPLPDVNVIRPY